MMDQSWFEMPDVTRRKLDSAVWVPLRACQTLRRDGKRGHLGYIEEFLGLTSIAVPLGKRLAAETLEWMDFGLMHDHKGFCEQGRYIPSDLFEGWNLDLGGTVLGLSQAGNSDDPGEWHLHQDLVISLGLRREENSWLAMDEDYIEAARLRKDDGRPVLLEVRAEQLKDYLCARGMALYVSSYRSREEVVEDASHINWEANTLKRTAGNDRWQGQKTDIHEGGEPFGGSMAVMHVGRRDVDVAEDVPTIGPFDENIVTDSWTRKLGDGKKLTRVRGELWRKEWIEPGSQSPRIRRDKSPSSVFFITDASGNRCAADKLERTGGWLWFRPELVTATLGHRGAKLKWYTRQTGGLKASSSTSYTHFGVNELGRVNVYAKDIIYLPDWAKTLWAGFNVGPEGGVSQELLAAQAQGVPADTQAPEEYLPKAFDILNKISTDKFHFRLFRTHDQVGPILNAVHRFRATDSAGLFALAKDLARLTADGIDAAAIQKIAPPPKGEQRASLKSLENLLARVSDPKLARSLAGPLVGIYQLRHGDAHLPGNDIEDAFELVHVDRTAPPITQGYQLIHACVSSLYAIAELLTAKPNPQRTAEKD